MPERKLSSWVDGFMKYTEKTSSPSLFRKWSGLFTIAAALERKVWVDTSKGKLYPNLYTFMVGPPAAGKTVSAIIGRDMLKKLNGHFISSTSVTSASIIDELEKSKRNFLYPKAAGVEHFNSLIIISRELSVLLPAYDHGMMSKLTDIYDCYDYSESRRTGSIEIEIPRSQINLLAATTPSFLMNLVPEGAWDQGFMSRVIMVYSGASAPGDLFAKTIEDEKLSTALADDLKLIGNIAGQMTLEPDAAEVFTDWHKTSINGGEPIPDHPRLVHYNHRRSVHLLKLCMLASAARSDNLIITIDDFAEALDWLIQVEASMPDIFKAMTIGGDRSVMDETWHFAYKIYMKENKPVVEGRIVAFIAERTPAHNVGRILEVMVKMNIFKETYLDHIGRAYVPKSRTS